MLLFTLIDLSGCKVSSSLELVYSYFVGVIFVLCSPPETLCGSKLTITLFLSLPASPMIGILTVSYVKLDEEGTVPLLYRWILCWRLISSGMVYPWAKFQVFGSWTQTLIQAKRKKIQSIPFQKASGLSSRRFYYLERWWNEESFRKPKVEPFYMEK